MLKLVLGTSGSGKTTLLYARIRARAEAGKRSILLVPEQFTSSTEARIYRELIYAPKTKNLKKPLRSILQVMLFSKYGILYRKMRCHY